jgi:uncharacterized membrane protein YcaP (DUF421 family)
MDIQAMLSSMFEMGVPFAEKIFRTLVVYAFLVVLLRIFGKREMAQVNPLDFIVLLTLSNTLQNAIIGNDNSVTGGIVGAFALVGFNYLLVRFLYGHHKIEEIVEGTSTVIIDNGRLDQKALEGELLTEEELQVAARRQGFSDLLEIDRCVLETSGTLSFVAKKPNPQEKFQKEILSKLESLGAEIAAIRAKVS